MIFCFSWDCIGTCNFQRAMDTLLQGIPHVICYIDDVLVTGLMEEKHLYYS